MSPSPEAGAPNATRGIVIVVVAAILGVFLLARGSSSTLVGASAKAAGKTATTVVNVPTIPKESPTAPPATNAPAGVKVAIFNGTGGKNQNAAGDAKRALTPLGYTSVSINDTTTTPKSVVYYATGSQGDAAAVAKAVGLPNAPVEPTSKAASLPAAASGSAVVVIIGQDAPAPSTSKTTSPSSGN